MDKTQCTFNPESRGMITGIGHGTMRDGPGWRTIVYFKGCNFRCAWCSSPETFEPGPQPMFFPARMKYPARLENSCPVGAISASDGRIDADRNKCSTCESYSCAELNIDGAAELCGRDVSVRELLDETLPYARSHEKYGVTLSGGEATLQWGFFLELLKGFSAHNLHTAVETNCSNPRMPECFPYLDLAICDLKIAGADEHEQWTGARNETVLKNIAAAAESGIAVWVRVPVVPGITDGENIARAAEFLSRFAGKIKVELLAYHALGAYKWAACGLEYSLEKLASPDEETMRSYQSVFKGHGLEIIDT